MIELNGDEQSSRQSDDLKIAKVLKLRIKKVPATVLPLLMI